jgi:hypothetical protein
MICDRYDSMNLFECRPTLRLQLDPILAQIDSLPRVLDHIDHLACQFKVTQGRKLRIAGAVVETNIHDPIDSTSGTMACACSVGRSRTPNPRCGMGATWPRRSLRTAPAGQ